MVLSKRIASKSRTQSMRPAAFLLLVCLAALPLSAATPTDPLAAGRAALDREEFLGVASRPASWAPASMRTTRRPISRARSSSTPSANIRRIGQHAARSATNYARGEESLRKYLGYKPADNDIREALKKLG